MFLKQTQAFMLLRYSTQAYQNYARSDMKNENPKGVTCSPRKPKFDVIEILHPSTPKLC